MHAELAPLSMIAAAQPFVGPVPPGIEIVGISPRESKLMIRAEIIEAQVNGANTQAPA